MGGLLLKTYQAINIISNTNPKPSIKLFRFVRIEIGLNHIRIAGATTSAPRRSPIHQVSHMSKNALLGVWVNNISEIVPRVAPIAVQNKDTSAKLITSFNRSNNS